MFPYQTPIPESGNGSASSSQGTGLHDRCARCGRPFTYPSEARFCTACLVCDWCKTPIGELDERRGCPSCEGLFCSEYHYLDHTFATGHHGW